MNTFIKLVFMGSLCVVSSLANATLISYDVTNVANNTWQYDYSITNDSLTTGIEEFSIYFDSNLYGNIRNGSGPLDWDLLVLDPDPLIPADGLFDALAFGATILLGETLSGFSVQFDFFGNGTPDSQLFEILNPLTFAVLDSGVTQLNGSSVPVPTPAPAALILLLVGLSALRLVARKSR